MSCGVGCRHGSDPALLWLWRRLAAAAPIRPLAWEPPICHGFSPRNGKKKRQKTNKQTRKKSSIEMVELIKGNLRCWIYTSSCPVNWCIRWACHNWDCGPKITCWNCRYSVRRSTNCYWRYENYIYTASVEAYQVGWQSSPGVLRKACRPKCGAAR